MKKFISVSASLSIIALVSFVFGTMVLKDDKFLMEAAQGGMAEVELSRIALQKTENEEIRRFAQMMIDEHTAANAELEQIAASKNMAMPTEMSKKHRDAMEKLNGLSGAEFDRAYMKQMVKDHQATVKLFEKQADRGTDADLKAFAAKTLPNLREHLRMARSMSGNMNNTNRNNNSNSDNNMNMNTDNMNSNRQNNSNRNMNDNSNQNSNSNRNMNNNMNNNSNRNMNNNTNSNSNRNMNNNSNRNMNNNMNHNSNRNMNSNSNVNGF